MTFLLVSVLLWGDLLFAGTDWNSAEIEWHSYHDGVNTAMQQKKIMMLVFHSEGCGACADYQHVFQEPSVVEASRDLVMVLIDDGIDEELSIQYSLDGSYVPRTYFVTPDESVLPIKIGKVGTRFDYYLGIQGAAVLVPLMRSAASSFRQ